MNDLHPERFKKKKILNFSLTLFLQYTVYITQKVNCRNYVSRRFISPTKIHNEYNGGVGSFINKYTCYIILSVWTAYTPKSTIFFKN